MSRLHYEVKGSGRPLVFIHGWGTDRHIWRHQIVHFSKQYKTIAIDLRGHGKSPWYQEPRFGLKTLASDVTEVILESGAEDVSVVGWSLGSLVAFELACAWRLPVALKSLVLISATPKFIKDGSYAWGQPEIVVQRMIQYLSRGNTLAVTQMFQQLLFSEQESRDPAVGDEWKTFVKQARLPHIAAMSATLKLLIDTDIRPRLGKLNVPVLLIHGRGDRMCRFEGAEFMRDRIAGSVLRVIDGAGHIPFLTQPRAVQEALADFL